MTVSAVVLGPLYARAAQESVLNDKLTSAPAVDTGLHGQVTTNLSAPGSFQIASESAPSAGFSPAYPQRIVGARVDTRVNSPGGGELAQFTRLVARQGLCAHLIVVAGRCPTSADEVMLSARTLQGRYGYRLGGNVTFPRLSAAVAIGQEVPVNPTVPSLKLVGTYRPRDADDPFWFDRVYFNATLGFDAPDTIDAVFVDQSAFATFDSVRGDLDVDYPLDASKVRLSSRDELVAAVRHLQTTSPAGGPTYTDSVEATLAGIAALNHQVSLGSLLVSLQLAALALFVLFAATADALDSRGGDVALAKLRGLTPFATLRILLGETVPLLLAAVPVGAALGLLATHALAATLLVDDVPVVFPIGAWAAAGAAFVGALVAAALAGRRVLTRSVLDEWRGAHRRIGRGRRTLAVEVVVAAAAAAGLVQLVTGDGGTTALVAPGLLVLAVALLGVRLVPVLARLAVPRTAGSARLGRFLAVRQVARRPSALRLTVLLAVAIGLAVFAVGGETIAVGNRADRAEVEVGAPRTVNVQFAPGADPVALTAAVDPDGRWAMTAAKWLPAGGTTVTGAVEAVDPTRLAAVAFPTTQGPSLVRIAHDLDPDSSNPIVVRGTTIQVTITTTDLTGVAPYVELLLRGADSSRLRVRIGTLQAGRQVYNSTVPCRDGCQFGGFGWTRPVSNFDPIGATVLVQAVAVSTGQASTPVDLTLGQPALWRARSPDATDIGTTSDVTVTADGVRDTFTSRSGASAGLAHAAGPSPLPVWASTGAIIQPPPQSDGRPGIPQVLDNYNNGYAVAPVGTTAALPGVKPGGVLADLESLRDQLPDFASEAAWQVWLGPHAPADALARLRTVGFDVGAVTDEVDRAARLGRQGPALALALLLACAIAAAVLAIGATATAIATTARRRSFELAALRVLGVPRRALARSTVLEQGLLLGSALVLGVPAGLLASVLAMPVIPQFSDTSPLPLRNTPQVWPLAVVISAFLVLLVVTAVFAGVSLVRAAVPARLRETSP